MPPADFGFRRLFANYCIFKGAHAFGFASGFAESLSHPDDFSPADIAECAEFSDFLLLCYPFGVLKLADKVAYAT